MNIRSGNLLELLHSTTIRHTISTRTESLIYLSSNSIKKPKTNRYPSLNGVDPKFRRNHRHALHGTMKALVR